jgi:hypothetical protein
MREYCIFIKKEYFKKREKTYWDIEIEPKEIVPRKLLFEEKDSTKSIWNNAFYVDEPNGNLYGKEEAGIFLSYLEQRKLSICENGDRFKYNNGAEFEWGFHQDMDGTIFQKKLSKKFQI